jgi:hypothetical protein
MERIHSIITDFFVLIILVITTIIVINDFRTNSENLRLTNSNYTGESINIEAIRSLVLADLVPTPLNKLFPLFVTSSAKNVFREESNNMDQGVIDYNSSRSNKD